MTDTMYQFRLNYYIKPLYNKEWKISFDQDTDTCYCDNNTYNYPNSEQHALVLIDSSFNLDMFRKMAKKRILDCVYSENEDIRSWFPEDSIPRWNGVIEYNINSYISPLLRLYYSEQAIYSKSLLHRIGDVYFETDIPILTKTKPITDHKQEKNVIIPFEITRHFIGPIKEVQEKDIKFENKMNKVVWRGAQNGVGVQLLYNRPCRDTLVKNNEKNPNENIDIGYMNSHAGFLHKSYMPIGEQLKYKFIISAEGGDVATNLKWILYSNSVCMMAKPTICSWFMEDLLEPWVHYIPLQDDFSDVSEKLQWAVNHMDECKQIVSNASEFMARFMNPDIERQLVNDILLKYVKQVDITRR